MVNLLPKLLGSNCAHSVTKNTMVPDHLSTTVSLRSQYLSIRSSYHNNNSRNNFHSKLRRISHDILMDIYTHPLHCRKLGTK